MRIAAMMACAMLAGCVTAAEPKMTWERLDGRKGPNAALARQFEIDRTICLGEVQRVAAVAPQRMVTTAPSGQAGVAGATSDFGAALGDFAATAEMNRRQNVAYADIIKGCMAQRGYRAVPVSGG